MSKECQNNSIQKFSYKNIGGLLKIINLSLPQIRESSDVKSFWIPAFAGMTFLEGVLIFEIWTSFEL
jgi:hypothetical protein